MKKTEIVPGSIAAWFGSRAVLRNAFLARHGLAGAELEPVGEDCAFRRYFRLTRGGKSVILMEAVPDGGDIATPGHKMIDYVRVGAYLRTLGLSAPQIYELDDENGYILLEDFGDTSFKKALERGVPSEKLYGLATDVLSALRRRAKADDIDLPGYYASHVHTGRRRVVDWFMPALRRAKNPDGLVEDYLAVWDAIEKSLPPEPSGFLHIDYHFENLMWMPGKEGLAAAGILDFQGAMNGPVPYDLANLLEDARVDVPQALRDAMMDRFCAGMAPDETALFKSWYRVLATQFHCRVAGQFIRLALRDDKPRYLAHLPRVVHYIENGLKDPVLAPLKKWFAAQGVDFSCASHAQDMEAARKFIRPDAF